MVPGTGKPLNQLGRVYCVGQWQHTFYEWNAFACNIIY